MPGLELRHSCALSPRLHRLLWNHSGILHPRSSKSICLSLSASGGIPQKLDDWLRDLLSRVHPFSVIVFGLPIFVFLGQLIFSGALNTSAQKARYLRGQIHDAINEKLGESHICSTSPTA